MNKAAAFSTAWLQLREGADQRARNRELANALSAWFSLRDAVTVTDLGSGTGSNLRAVAPLLPQRQAWRLIDNDPALLSEARDMLRRWADHSEPSGAGGLQLRKGNAVISVAFERIDLARGLDNALDERSDLITASALFDLVSPAFIKSLVRRISGQRAAVYATLTYNGLQKWAPRRPTDSQVAAAFNRHQMTDKGFGPAAGPEAGSVLADQLRLEGYSVQEGDSPWGLGAQDRMLIEELQRGHAMAVLELRTLDDKTVETWVRTMRSAVEIGHTDIFAVPGSAPEPVRAEAAD